MDFDVNRALAFANRLITPRLAGTENERAAGDQIAEEFQAAGLTVDRREAIGSRFPEVVSERVGWVIFALLPILAYFSKGDAAQACLVFWVLWTGAMGLGLFSVLGRRLPPYSISPVVVSRGAEAESAPVRVVFITHLDSNPKRWVQKASAQPGWFAWQMTLFDNICMAVFSALYILFTYKLTHRLFPKLLARMNAAEARGDADNAAGLALLAEMARANPLEDVETWFVAVGGRTVHQSGARLLAKILRDESPNKPTFVVNLHDPGRSATLFLNGTDPVLWTARMSARDLGFERCEQWGYVLGHWPLQRGGFEALTLAGDSFDWGIDLKISAIRPEMLAATANVAFETASRWARRKRGTAGSLVKDHAVGTAST